MTELTIGTPQETRRIERALGLRLNRAQCERFLNPNAQYFSETYNDSFWYDKSEFIHESELVPIERWTTRYIYLNSYLSMMGSELMSREEEREEDRINSYAAYSQQRVRRGLSQFSDDGYYLDPETGIRWRIMRHPYRPPDDPEREFPNLTLIDESGRYLPLGLPSLSIGGRYRFQCTGHRSGGYSCGYGPTPEWKIQLTGKDPVYSDHIAYIPDTFSGLQITSDRITITRRVSYGEPFRRGPGEGSEVNHLFFYANFDDPIRPVYFSPGLLLKDVDSLNRRPRPEPDDFVREEVCLTDCPDDIVWQVTRLPAPRTPDKPLRKSTSLKSTPSE